MNPKSSRDRTQTQVDLAIAPGSQLLFSTALLVRHTDEASKHPFERDVGTSIHYKASSCWNCA